MLKSECVRCGRRMVRLPGTAGWIAYKHRDLRAQLAPVRVLADRLTGPVLFLLGITALLGLAAWLGGVEPHTPANFAARR